MKIIYFVPKEEIAPKLGEAFPNAKIIKIQKGLPEKVEDFVKAHEFYHLKDTTKFWLWREIKANFHAAKKHPGGFIQTILLSLTKERLQYYLDRFKKKR